MQNAGQLQNMKFQEDDRHIAVTVAWSIYQRIIAAYSHPDRRRGKIMVATITDSLRAAVPAGLEELAQLGRTLRRRRAGLLRPPHLQRTHRSHQRTPGSATPQRPRLQKPYPLRIRSLLHCGNLTRLINAL